MITHQQLRARFAAQFAGPDIGLSFAQGWIDIVEALCEDVEQTLCGVPHGFRWIQMKEKFGVGWFYFTLAADPVSAALRQPLQARVNAATHRTGLACIVCGQQAGLDRSSPYVPTLCARHAAQRLAGIMESPWFKEDL